MLYEKYRNKVRKRLLVWAAIVKYKWFIIGVLALITLLSGSYCGLKGAIIGESKYPTEIVYGENFEYSASSIFSAVRYEYAKKGDRKWTEEKPILVGDYQVRAVSSRIFGKENYGKVRTFSIKPFETTVKINGDELQYGDDPVPVSELRYGDRIWNYKLSVEEAGLKKINVDLENGSVKITGKNGEDRTSQYLIKTEGKQMSLVKRKLTVNVLDKEVVYDGTEQSFSDYELGDDTTFAYDDRPVTEIVTKATDVCENTPIDLKLKIFNASGEEVTDFYDLQVNKGNLTIKKREIEITGRNFEETYDGDPHTFGEFDLSEKTPLADGQEITVAAASSFTVVGEYENDLTATIKDENDVDVSKNYSVTVFPGSVTINKRELKVVTNSDTFTYDGEAHSVEGFTIVEPTSLAEGQEFVASGYGRFTHAGEYENEITFDVTSTKNSETVAENYNVTVTAGTVAINKRDLYYATGSGEWVYDGEEHFNVNIENVSGVVASEHFEGKNSNFPKITDVGEVQNTLDLKIYHGAFEVTKNYNAIPTFGTLKVTPRSIKVLTSSAEKVYDGTPLTAKSYSFVNGTTVGGQNLSVEYVNSQTDAGTTKNAINPDTMKIIDSIGGEKTKNYSVAVEYGDLTVTPRPVNFVTGSGEKYYDGLAFSLKEIQVSDGTPLVEGHTVASSEVDYFGELTDAGSIENSGKIKSVTIKDGSGKDVSKNYAVGRLLFGTLTVKPRPITIKTGTASWTYDDKSHSFVNAEEISLEGGLKGDPLVIGHRAVAEQNNSTTVIEAGSYTNYVEFRIEDSESYADVTNNYNIKYLFGTLTIDKKPLKIVTYSAEKTYDGTPITFDNATEEWKAEHGEEKYYVDGSSVVEGHSVEVYGYNTPISYRDNGHKNTATVKVYKTVDGGVSDKTANYDITTEEGLLVVNRLVITYSTYRSEKIFDGEILTGDWSCEAFYGDNTRRSHGVTENLDYALSSGLLRRFTLKFSSILYMGGADNRIIDYTVTDDAGNSLPSTNYLFELKSGGSLWVNYRNITVKTNGVNRKYDGTAFSVEGYTYTDNASDYNTGLIVSPEAGKRKHNIEVRFKSFKNVADSGENMPLEVLITRDGDGLDLTKGYLINYDCGEIEITKRGVTFVTGSGEWLYDGVSHYNRTYTVKEGNDGVVKTHVTRVNSIVPTVRIPSLNIVDNEFSIEIYDENGKVVSENYDIDYEYGKLKVNGYILKIHTGSDYKYYDGKSLTYDFWRLVEVVNCGMSEDIDIDEFPENIKIVVEVYGSITDVGTEPNSAQAVVIEKYIADGETRYKLAAGYYPEITAGELKILADDGTGGTGGGEDKRGGTLDDSGKIEGGGNPSQGSTSSGGGSMIALEVKSGADGTAYFRYMSFGDYDGKGWSKASQYGQLIEGRYSYNYLASYALQNLGYSATNAEIKSYSSYMLPYFTVAGLGDYVVQRSDTVYDGTIPAEYTLGYIPFDYLTSKSDLAKFSTYLPDNLVDYESEYRSFVYKNYLSVPTKTRAYLESVIEKEGFVAAEDKYRDVLRVAKYVQSVAKYNANYDPMMNYERDIVIAFMRDYKEGICQHYASAATLLFRTLGIPARYTIGYAGQTKSNEWTEIVVQNAHAWVEIYVDGFGWVSIEVTGGGVGGGTGGSGSSGGNGGGSGEIDDGSGGGGSGETGGGGEGESKKIIVKPVDVDKAYDGTPLYALNEIEENAAIKKLLEQGYVYEVVVSGSRTERGESESVIEEFRLLDKSGRDATADFEIIYKNGKIKITNTQIIVNLYKITKYYDGTPLSYDEDDYWVEDLPSGYKLELKLSGSITEVGTFDIEKLYELPVKVTDENGNDVTANYYVKFVGEGLTVMPNKITVVTNSAEKVYDGKALSSLIAWVGLGKLVDGHIIQIDETSVSEITEKGEIENRLKVKIVDENGEDVTENYEITYQNGKLTVN